MNAMRLDAMRWKFAARTLVVLWPLAIAAVASTPQPTPHPMKPIQFPRDYRSWQHVRTIVIGPEHRSFASRGGIHHYYANEQAVEGYRTGRFPNGSIIVDEGIFTEDGTGQAKGMVMEGHRRSLDVMVKNDRLYGDTGGWGFENFKGQESAGTLDAKGRTQCFECHAKSKGPDHVFTAIRVAKFAPDAGTSTNPAAR
jgi:hypothetical protein